MNFQITRDRLIEIAELVEVKNPPEEVSALFIAVVKEVQFKYAKITSYINSLDKTDKLRVDDNELDKCNEAQLEEIKFSILSLRVELGMDKDLPITLYDIHKLMNNFFYRLHCDDPDFEKLTVNELEEFLLEVQSLEVKLKEIKKKMRDVEQILLDCLLIKSFIISEQNFQQTGRFA